MRDEQKSVVFDIDGTLLSERTHTIPDSALAALRKAREAGHLVFINSGRTRCLMQEVENGVPVDGYLCGCGTYIEIRGKKVLHRIIPAARRMEIHRAIVDHRLEGILEGVTGVSMQKGNSHLEAVERTKKILLNSRVLHEADWYEAPLDFDKFCVLEDAGSDAAGFLEFLKPDFSPIDRGGGLYECIPAGFSKATAMEYVLRYFGIRGKNPTRSETAAMIWPCCSMRKTPLSWKSMTGRWNPVPRLLPEKWKRMESPTQWNS